MAMIEILAGSNVGQRYELTADQTVLGRDAFCDVVFPSRTVSRQHARIIRAVCTIEGMNRILGTVTIKDPRGKLHVIGDVEPAKMEGVTLGQTIVVVYAEALALTLEQI